MRNTRWLPLLLPVFAFACGEGFGTEGFDDGGAPPEPPSTRPPTGNKWDEIEVEGECGRTTLAYVLVDEVCGGTDDPGYMAAFHAPIMRDGARFGDTLYAADASYLWVLDVADPTSVERRQLLSGFGQPLALASHAGRLLVAAGDEGLLLVDTSVPEAPVRLDTLALPGPALDVYVEADRAYVANGAEGVAVVDLSLGDLSLEKTLEAPGFAAAVAAEAGTVYVAACTTFATIDLETGALLGQTWLEDAEQEGILVAPAKDVALHGGRAFVAAGRFGAVEIDLADLSAPAVVGNCTLQDDLLFYASGVRHDGERLFIAAGEWGVMPVPLSAPLSGCQAIIAPELPPPPTGEEACTTEPPWEVLNWQETWLPPPAPPPGRDPLQTLPEGGRLWAFGDATRIGLRAIDVRDATDPELAKIGRYAEPRLTEGIAAHGDRVLVAGRAGGLFRTNGAGLLELESRPAKIADARVAAFLGDGRWVLGGPSATEGAGEIWLEGGSSPITVASELWPGTLATQGGSIFVPLANDLQVIDAANLGSSFRPTGRTAILPPSVSASASGVLLAAPEWPDALVVAGSSSSPLSPQGAVDSSDFGSVSLWRKGLPRRVLLDGPTGPVEIVSLGGEAGLSVHGASTSTVMLPPGDYLAGAVHGSHAYALRVDRGRYRTQLVTVALDRSPPAVVASQAFTGNATGAATANGRLYVADGDRGVRVYDLAGGKPTALGVVELAEEVTP